MDEIEELNRKVNPGNNGSLAYLHFNLLLFTLLNFIVHVAGAGNSPRKRGTV